METRPTSLSENLAFGEVKFSKPTPEQDRNQGYDAWLGEIPIAWRRRRIPLSQYGEISIRRTIASGGKTEIDKLLDGSFKAQIYVFQFPDAVVICLVKDIIECLKAKKYSQQSNRDFTSAVYIKLKDINHLLIGAMK